MLLVNKCDLESEWSVEDARLEALAQSGWDIRRTSAKEGLNVEDAFLALTKRMVGESDKRGVPETHP